MELPVNRALTTTQREAEMGKARGSFATQEDPGNMQLVMQKQTGALCVASPSCAACRGCPDYCRYVETSD